MGGRDTQDGWHHRLDTDQECRDLLREDAELLPHPQDSSRPHAGGEVTEGQGLEATGDCREGERAQHFLGNTSLEPGTWGAG